MEKFLERGRGRSAGAGGGDPEGDRGRHAGPDLLHLGQEGRRRRRTARRPQPARPLPELRQAEARHRPQQERQRQADRADRGVRVPRPGVQGGQRQVRRQPELHPRLSGKLDPDHQRHRREHRQDGPRRAAALHPGQDARRRAPRRSPATSSPWPRWRTCTSATPSPCGRTPRSCRRSAFPTPMFGLAVEPKNRGDEQKISASLHKIADEDPTFKVTHDPQTHEMVITGMSQLHLDVDAGAAQAALRPGGGHARAEDPVPRDDHARRARATTGTRSRPAAAASSARSTCASTRCRARSPARSSSWRSSPTSRSSRSCGRSTTTRRYNFAFIDHIVGGTIPNQFIPAVEKGCKELLERGALAGYRMQDIARRGLLRQVPRRGQLRGGVQDGRPARVQEGVPGRPRRCCWSRSSSWR